MTTRLLIFWLLAMAIGFLFGFIIGRCTAEVFAGITQTETLSEAEKGEFDL